ncbi:glycosyl hydrolase family 18 protein [Cohnella sp.]|uniref:glycosyl hydrolase family 18 protein n=1 Tax=Cohnella sp. TaxID=1883426 RepID=UPI003704AB30
MNRHHVYLRVALLTFVLAVLLIPMPPGNADSDVKVTYNGNTIEFQTSPFVRNDATYVQARPLLNAAGLQVQWIDKTRFKLFRSGIVVDMEVGKTAAALNGSSLSLTHAPILSNSTLFLPIRPISALIGLNVQWFAGSNTIALTTAGSTKPSASPYRIVAYYPYWASYQQLTPSRFATSEITHLNYAFANVQRGEVVMGDAAADRANFAELKRIKKDNPKLKTLISVGGWNWSGSFSDVALTAAARTKFAESAVRFIRDNGFDGVDLDWEYPVAGGLSSNRTRPEDKRNFTLLLKELKAKLDDAGKQDGKPHLLTIAAGASSGYISNTEMNQVAAIVDWVNLMTYDYHGSWEKTSNHHAPLYSDPKRPSTSGASANDTVNAFMKAGVPANKLVLGVPFYGRGWAGCGSTGNGLEQTCTALSEGVTASGVHEFGNLENLGWLDGSGFVRYWDDTAKVPWLYNKKTGTFITYEDPESLAYKAGYVKAKGLGGAVVWELSQDFNGTLLRKLAQSLR